MPISASNFSPASLTGSVVINNGFANISLTTIPQTLIGNQTFSISLRTGSPTGPILTTSPLITIFDNSNVTVVTANVATVNEGDLVLFSVTTENCPDGTAYFSVVSDLASVNSADFTSNAGSFAIVSNSGSFVLQAARDNTIVDETGEKFKVQIRGNSPTGIIKYTSSNVTINDTSNSMVFNSLVSNTSLMISGMGVSFTLLATGAARTLSYMTEGNVISSDFVGGNTGSFAITNSGTATVSLYPSLSLGAGQTRYFQLRVFETANVNNQILSSNTVNIIDNSVFKYTATGGNLIISGGYNYHIFRSSDTFTIAANTGTYLGLSGLVTSPIEILAVAAGGGGGHGYANYPGDYASAGGGGGGGVAYTTVPYANAQIGAAGAIVVSVGGGGAGGTNPYRGFNGSNTTIVAPSFSHTIFGGGAGGGGGGVGGGVGFGGGSGGGSGGGNSNGPAAFGPATTAWAATGNSPAHPVTSYGFGGGAGGPAGPVSSYAGGGGGAGQAGVAGEYGGNGISTYSVWTNATITGVDGYLAGGGGQASAYGGLGGGGLNQRTNAVAVVNKPAWNANAFSGGGGAGGGAFYQSPSVPGDQPGGSGGSGLVIIRYPA